MLAAVADTSIAASSSGGRTHFLGSLETRLKDLIEFSRAVHAEMDAIISASRHGTSLKGSEMFSTTFPCHLCARHIVAAGIKAVYYIEPYEKSLAITLHRDSIQLDPTEPEGLEGKVLFQHFEGVAPQQYLNLFHSEDERKEDGRISDIWNYDAKLAGIISRPQINLETKDLEGLQSGKRVTVQGEFVGFLGQPEGEWYDKYNSGIVKTENGKEIYLDFPTGKITFSGGVLENLVHQDPRKHPEIGDKIKIAAFITRAKREPKVMVEGTDPGVRLAAHWCDPCYLDEPCESRQKNMIYYDQW